MIDVHCHLNFHAYEKNVDEIIQKAHADGVTKIINVGTKLDSSQKAIELASKYDNLYAIVGVHPHHADKKDLGFKIPSDAKAMEGKQDLRKEEDWLKELERLAKHPKVVAIGEIGLDYYSYHSNGIVDPKLQPP